MTDITGKGAVVRLRRRRHFRTDVGSLAEVSFQPGYGKCLQEIEGMNEEGVVQAVTGGAGAFMLDDLSICGSSFS